MIQTAEIKNVYKCKKELNSIYIVDNDSKHEYSIPKSYPLQYIPLARKSLTSFFFFLIPNPLRSICKRNSQKYILKIKYSKLWSKLY